jgi:hypothetical protein
MHIRLLMAFMVRSVCFLVLLVRAALEGSKLLGKLESSSFGCLI